MDRLLFRVKLPDRQLKLQDFWKSLYMLKYLSVLIPGLFYMTAFGYGSVIFASTGSQLFHQFYNFTTSQTGLMLSIPLLIGCFIGEANAGWLTDWMVRRYAKKHDGHRLPEARLNALWFGLLTPIGMIIVGICFTHYKTVPWVGTAFGMGIASLGLQAATTVTYTYTTDVSHVSFSFTKWISVYGHFHANTKQCFKPQSAELSVLLNLFRSIYSMTISFYA